MWWSACLLLVSTMPAQPMVDGNATIRGRVGDSEIVIRTTSRLAGAIDSLTWNGKEFIDSADHGRQLQSASNLNAGKRMLAETFNPTEAGSRADGAGPRSSSKLLALEARGNELRTRTQMAFWLRPGEKSAGNPAYNTTVLSNHLVAKCVRIGYADMPNVLDYQVTFTLPAGEHHTQATFEALTGYMPWEFADFFAFNPGTGKLEPLTDGPGEQSRPVVLATRDGRHAMGIYTPPGAGRSGPGYGRWRFTPDRVVKWNCVFRFERPDGIPPGDHTFQIFVPVGTKAECEAALRKLTQRFQRPNIITILADDLGIGDVRCFNPASKIATPHLDRMAARGMKFTDAHSGSSVCTPTRYGLLTGRYAWRSQLASGVLGGYSPRLIEPGRLTVAAFLRQHGYHTACIGKWHLGIDWPLKAGGTARDYPDAWKVDYSRPFTNGPRSVGFDQFFGISASLDMPPYIYLAGDRCQGEPTVEKTWIRKGPAHKDFEAVDVLPRLTSEALTYIRERAPAAKKGQPFFLYLPLASPHTPILPTPPWKGKSKLGDYADFVQQTDDAVGQILAELDRLHLTDNTLILFTSDNGCSPMAGITDLEARGHRPSAQFRGHKADIFEGGHRVPFLAQWPGVIPAGKSAAQLACLTDLLATTAEILGVALPSDAGEDSVSLLPALRDTAPGTLRETCVHHSVNGSFAIRQGKWKLCLCPGSGGWSKPRPGKEEAGLPPVQLYDLEADPGERTNLQAQHPEVVARLTQLLERQSERGRSTPGPAQKNARAVRLRPGK
ncbi:MAG: arylsulfatase [Gemmataceae bacterium]